MKKNIIPIIFILLLFTVVIFNDKVTNLLANYLSYNQHIVIDKPNSFKKTYNFKYVKNSNNFIPYSYNDLLDVIFTYLNNGWDTFTFYCPDEYINCINDVKDITKSEEILTDINNYVNPYNNFISLNTTIDSSGEITLTAKKIYSDNQIDEISSKITDIESSIYTSDMDIVDKLKAAHDYIIANSTYDINRKEKNSSKYLSNIAYGPLFQGYAICSGYADTMALFITNLNIKNFKVASKTHVWNALYIDNEWLNIDATWDDQMDTDGNESLIHKFFLINTANMQKYASTDHEFDKSIYRELYQ